MFLFFGGWQYDGVGDDDDGGETNEHCRKYDEEKRQREQQTVVVSEDDSSGDSLTEELMQKALSQANDAKVEGNELFKDGKYEDALLKYEAALHVAPETPRCEPAPQATTETPKNESTSQAAPEKTKREPAPPVAPEMTPVVELRSICHFNRAVCFLKLAKYEESVKEC